MWRAALARSRRTSPQNSRRPSSGDGASAASRHERQCTQAAARAPRASRELIGSKARRRAASGARTAAPRPSAATTRTRILAEHKRQAVEWVLVGCGTRSVTGTASRDSVPLGPSVGYSRERRLGAQEYPWRAHDHRAAALSAAHTQSVRPSAVVGRGALMPCSPPCVRMKCCRPRAPPRAPVPWCRLHSHTG